MKNGPSSMRSGRFIHTITVSRPDRSAFNGTALAVAFVFLAKLLQLEECNSYEIDYNTKFERR